MSFLVQGPVLMARSMVSNSDDILLKDVELVVHYNNADPFGEVI